MVSHDLYIPFHNIIILTYISVPSAMSQSNETDNLHVETASSPDQGMYTKLDLKIMYSCNCYRCPAQIG